MAPSAIFESPAVEGMSVPETPITSRKRRLLSPTQTGSKRRKVQFSPQVEVRLVEENEGKSQALIREEIRHAIRQHEVGDSENYMQIKTIFTAETHAEDAPSNLILKYHLLGLSSNITLLKKSCSDLIHAVLRTEWLQRDDMVATTFTRFLGTLVSAHSGYLSEIIRMFVQHFVPGDNIPVEDERKYGDRVHTGLKYLLHLVPSAASVLLPTLTVMFPFSTEGKTSHIAYVKNVLRLLTYAPELRADVLDLIVERLTKMDAEVQNDIQDLEDDVDEILVEDSQAGIGSHPFAQTQNEDSDLESVLSDESLSPEAQHFENLRRTVEKLDAILDALFSYQSPIISKGTSPDSQALFDQLVSQFQKTILPTYRSRHTQFLLFHFAQTSPSFTSQFLDSCLNILKDKARSPVIRSSAAAYVGSFVARGARVAPETVAYVFDALAQFLDQLREDATSSCPGPDLRRFPTYYATMQALIYIFCFRWRDLLADPEDMDAENDDDLFDGRELIWAPGVKEAFTQNIYSNLNPLKICAPGIVEEFARISHHLKFLYIYQIIESNKRLRLSHPTNSAYKTNRETSLTSKHGEQYHQLDAYFPYDPYRLPTSKKWLAGDYIEWKALPGLQDSGDFDDSESGEDDNFDSYRISGIETFSESE